MGLTVNFNMGRLPSMRSISHAFPVFGLAAAILARAIPVMAAPAHQVAQPDLHQQTAAPNYSHLADGDRFVRARNLDGITGSPQGRWDPPEGAVRNPFVSPALQHLPDAIRPPALDELRLSEPDREVTNFVPVKLSPMRMGAKRNDPYEVKRLQRLLAEEGFGKLLHKKGAASDGVDGEFGRMTKLALIEFQKKHNIAPTGEVDLQTIELMDTLHPLRLPAHEVIFGETHKTSFPPSISKIPEPSLDVYAEAPQVAQTMKLPYTRPKTLAPQKFC